VSVSIPDFWKLLGESRLLPPQQVQQLAAEFGQAKQTAEPTAKTVAQWLVSRNLVSRYQAMIVLGGRSGPFYYGDYKVYDRVEQGRLAGCFRAVHAATGHPVLLKFLTGIVSSDPRAWSAAAANIQAAASIVSPHVQRYFEPVDLQSFKFVVSEDLRGGTAEELLARSKCPPAEACRIARLAALGLVQMHAAGRVHGNLRPANLLLQPVTDQPANVKLLFDAHEAPSPLDLADQQPASRLAEMADYLAPELAAAGRAPDPLTDIYALGCTLYTLLAGQPPFAGGDVRQKLARHASEAIRPLESLGVPQPIGQLVAYLMAKKPTVRYQSATQAAEQLAIFVEPAALRLSLPSPPPKLAAFEQHVRQGRAQNPAAATTATGLPQIMTGGSRRSSPGFSTGHDRFAALAGDAAAPITVAAKASSTAIASAPAPVIELSVPAKGRAGKSAEEILRRRRKQQQRNMLVGLVASVLIAAVAIGGGLWWRNQQAATQTAVATENGQTPLTTASTSGSTTGAEQNAASSAPAGGSSAISSGSLQPLMADDGKTLWASPTSGQPVSFRCVPPEGQVFLVLRPATLVASPEGARVLAALGPSFAAQRQALEAASGFTFEDIEQLHITLHNNDAKFPRTSFVIRTKEPFTPEQQLAKWGNPSATKEKDETYYVGPAWAYYIPHSAEDKQTFAMGEARDIKEVAAVAGTPPVIFREIERLRRTTDAQRHFTLLLYPQFLFNDDGEPLFAAERAKVRQPLAWLLGDQLQAACVSVNLGDEFYYEMRMLASLDKEPLQLAHELKDRLDKIPAALEDYFVSLNPPAYWKKLAFRYPAMIRELHNQMRVGVENDQAIVNTVLPASAAHNLVLGAELLVSTAPGQGTSVSVAAAPAAGGPKTIADALQMKTSYSFDNQSLEFAMRDLADDVKGNLKSAPFEFAIKIIGDDLKIDGITRNQSIRDFKQENQTVADILTALVRKANPVTTVKDPSEKDQKLIWVIGPDPESPGKQIVLITTRAAATTKKYTLPAPFVAKKP
jgi:serine/threonine protein kinase